MPESTRELENKEVSCKPGDTVSNDWVQNLDLNQIFRFDRKENNHFGMGSAGASIDNFDTAGLYRLCAPLSTGAHRDSAAPVPGDGQPPSVMPAADDRSDAGSDASRGAPADSNDKTGNVLPESQHTIAKGETLEGIARELLGPDASQQKLYIYTQAVIALNDIDPNKLQVGAKLDMPGHREDGAITFTNPDNKDEFWAEHRDGSVEVQNKADGTSYTRMPIDDIGSYEERHRGSRPDDNYDVTFTSEDHYTLTTRRDANGNTVETGSDGYKKTTDQKGNWVETFPVGSKYSKYDRVTYDKATDVTTLHSSDGSKITISGEDKHTVAIDPDGTVTTKWSDGTVMPTKHAEGHNTGHLRRPDRKGGYTEHGWGPHPGDNYDETYDSRTGTTRRVEGKGTASEKTTTRWDNGSVRVESADGMNYQRNRDGSEHHWGKENYHKPAHDLENDKRLAQERQALLKAAHDHIPSGKRAAFRKDMQDFEKRSKKDHLSPEEVSRTYEQIARLLNAPDSAALVPGKDRELLAEGLIHQCANPDNTNQGDHNTCNVTAEVKKVITKKPALVAEIAATTALNGQWTAPDGKVIKIDRQSLKPGAEESVYPPVGQGDRSYATQVLNLVMANDALQRRVPPESYIQKTPDLSTPDDTGERRLNARVQVITTRKCDPETGIWKTTPDNTPDLSDREISQIGTRLIGHGKHFVSVGDAQGGVESVESADELGHKLHQLKRQGEFPITMHVDSNHIPITNRREEKPGYSAHIVSIDGYDEKTRRVHISNQWGKHYNRWVLLEDLYNNASGEKAESSQ